MAARRAVNQLIAVTGQLRHPIAPLLRSDTPVHVQRLA
jgi:hypothetical protein